MKMKTIAVMALAAVLPFVVFGKKKTLVIGDQTLEPDTSLTFSMSDGPDEINGMEVLAEYLPDGIDVTWTGSKFKVPKAGKVKYSKKEEDFVSKKDENMCGFKISVNKKSGTVKGSFKVYVQKSDKKLKAYSASFRGTLGDGGITVSVRGAGSYDASLD